MACRGFFEWVLKLLNFVVMVVGLAMMGYGAYLLVAWLQLLPSPPLPPAPAVAPGGGGGGEMVRLGRPLLLLLDVSSLPDGTAERLSAAWFIYAFIGVGVILFITSIFGCAGASRGGCCLSFVSKFNMHVIPVDKTGNFDMMYSFLKENWRIAKWVALGAVLFEAVLFTVALIVQSGNQADYDSDDEYIAPRSSTRQPLVNKQPVADPRVPNLDYRPIRNDAWSQRMREKYGVDTFDPNRFQQATISPAEQRNRCAIL
uniref:Tobamovirus multiplication protein 2A n=1 Tax=Oryza glumipatula TaxID=40148 RepID=A0A0E0AR32_9ORYZ